jgi:hypothetical protein
MNNRFSKVILFFSFCAWSFFPVSCTPAFAQQTDVAALIDGLSQRMENYAELKGWKAQVDSTITRMDKNWQPKTVTAIKKIVKVKNGEREEDVLEAKEAENGAVKDVTEKYVKESEKHRREALKKAEEQKKKGKDADDNNRRKLTQDDLFPFSKERRGHFEFFRRADSTLDGIPVYVIESKARVKDSKFWEGRYLIRRDTLDVLKIALRPSKNPKLVKELEMEVEFVLFNDSPVVKSSRMKVWSSLLIKNIRMVIEEKYSDFAIWE